MANLIRAEDVLAEDLRDPAFRAEWERTALARALAKAVLGYRMRHKLTQTALAQLLGMRQPHVARLELGEHNPSLEMLQRLSSRLGLRFVVDVVPPPKGTRRTTPAIPRGLEVVQDVTGPDGSRVLVAAG